jgi:hypothetical protein
MLAAQRIRGEFFRRFHAVAAPLVLLRDLRQSQEKQAPCYHGACLDFMTGYGRRSVVACYLERIGTERDRAARALCIESLLQWRGRLCEARTHDNACVL